MGEVVGLEFCAAGVLFLSRKTCPQDGSLLKQALRPQGRGVSLL